MLLQTKLHVPSARAALVARSRLVTRLNESLNRKLTLVSAPAGYGKTTLVGEWSRKNRWQAGWISLDEGDNDPVRFLSYLAAAARRALPEMANRAREMLHSPQPVPPNVFLTALLNDMETAGRSLVLVLDDYHRISTQAVHHVLSFLLDHLPPNLHLVLLTRADPPLPLSLLRARGEMTELRAADLRFTVEEATAFLNECMGLALAAEDVAALQARTEGWITGLQLAALSLQGQDEVSAFVERFSGSHRYIIDYLTDEVLGRQPEKVRRFLFQTAVLERLSAPLCDAVTEGDGSQTVLERLEAKNLFVTPLEDERRWYRYHRLFADMLHIHLRREYPELVPVLHRRAATWYAANAFVSDAIQHATAGEHWAQAAELLEENAATVFMRGEAGTLLRWLTALPEEQVRVRPALCLTYAWVLLATGQLDAVEPRLKHAERALKEAQEGDARAGDWRGHIAAIRGELACSRGDGRLAVHFSRQALDMLSDEDTFVQGMAAVNVALHFDDAYGTTLDIPTVEQILTKVVRATQATGNLHAGLYAARLLGRLEVAQGRLRKAAKTYGESIEFARQQAEPPLPLAGLAYVGLGELHYEWNELQAAGEKLEEGIRLGEQAGDLRILVPGQVALARLQQALGDAGAANQAVEEAERLARESGISWLRTQVAAGRVYLWLGQGEEAAAGRWAETCGLRIGDQIGYRQEGEYAALAQVLLAQGELEQALKLLDWLEGVFESSGLTGILIELRLLQALAHQAQNRSHRALAVLKEALSLAEPEGYVCTFVDKGSAVARLLHRAVARGLAPGYAIDLIAAFDTRQGERESHPRTRDLSGHEDLVEPLTERELEVLRLVAAGLTNREIAEELVIVVGTVKGHTHKIYGKLGVSNRVQAVERARQLDLL